MPFKTRRGPRSAFRDDPPLNWHRFRPQFSNFTKRRSQRGSTRGQTCVSCPPEGLARGWAREHCLILPLRLPPTNLPHTFPKLSRRGAGKEDGPHPRDRAR